MSNGNRAGALEHVVNRLGDLPSMPEAVREALRLMDSPMADASEVSAAIERDPALTAKLLRLSNSSYYGLKRQIGSIRLALVVLGMREVRNVLLGMSAFDSAQKATGSDVLIQDIWRHSLEVAALSKKLGSDLRLGLQGEDFVAGLLHDVGKAVLMSKFGGEYRKIYLKTDSKTPLVDREQELAGCTHAEVGAALLQYWALPEALVDALWFHHAASELPLSDAKDPALAAVVRLANLAAHDDFSSDPPSSHACQEHDAWSQFDMKRRFDRPENRYSILAPLIAEIQAFPDLAY